MDNIIRITKENNDYYLTYKGLKEICYIGKNGLTKNKKEELLLDKNLEYFQINKNLFWVDDSNSKHYNCLVDITKVKKDWISAENLLENKILMNMPLK